MFFTADILMIVYFQKSYFHYKEEQIWSKLVFTLSMDVVLS